MTKIIITNAFSIQMLEGDDELVQFREMSLEEVHDLLESNEFVSAIGHSDTANVVSNLLGIDVPMNRINVSLKLDTVLIVAQLMGGRLPEGTTKLPEGFKIKFIEVGLVDY